MRFSKQEYWSGLPCPLQGIFLTQGLNPGLPHCRWILYLLSHQGRWGEQKLAGQTGWRICMGRTVFSQKVLIKYKQARTSILDLVVAEKIIRFTPGPLFFSAPISHASEVCWLYLSWRSTTRPSLTLSLHCCWEQATGSPAPNHCLPASALSPLLS